MWVPTSRPYPLVADSRFLTSSRRDRSNKTYPHSRLRLGAPPRRMPRITGASGFASLFPTDSQNNLGNRDAGLRIVVRDGFCGSSS
jgi:hypothetical protein